MGEGKSFSIKRLDDGLLVPARWLVIIVGAAISCLGASFYLVFTVSSLTTRYAVGQEDQGQRISALETNSLLGRSHYTEIIQRLTIVETQNKETLRVLERIEGKL